VNRTTVILFVALLVIFGGGAMYLVAIKESQDNSVVPLTLGKTGTASQAEPVGWQTYKFGPPVNFSIDNPSDWVWIVTYGEPDGRFWQIQFDGTTSNRYGIEDYVDLVVDEGTATALENKLIDKTPFYLADLSGWEGRVSGNSSLSHEIEIILQGKKHVYHFSLPESSSMPMRVLKTFKPED
jgi:hypothetical protein